MPPRARTCAPAAPVSAQRLGTDCPAAVHKSDGVSRFQPTISAGWRVGHGLAANSRIDAAPGGRAALDVGGVLHKNAMSTQSLLPDDLDLDPIHTRRYETRVYAVSDEELLVRAAVSDTKPPGLYIQGDPDALEIHQMQIELRVAYPALLITAARVVFETHPHTGCPLIADAYSKLVGLSITRGFSARVRELFGGNRGCTHTNALLQAMAPAVVQSIWSLSVRRGTTMGGQGSQITAAEREQRIAGNLNTCHVWAEDGGHVEKLRRGDTSEFPPLPVKHRLLALGRDDDAW